MFKVVTTWTAPQGGPYYNNMYYSGTGGAQAAEAHAATVDFWELFPSFINAAYQPTVEAEVTEYNEATGAPVGVFTVSPVPVTMTGSSQPIQFASQVLIQISTNSYFGSRRVRGRIFVPGFGEDSTQGGKPDASVVNTVSGLVDAWRAGQGPTHIGVWSRTNLEFVDAAGCAMWSQFAVLRSRRD